MHRSRARRRARRFALIGLPVLYAVLAFAVPALVPPPAAVGLAAPPRAADGLVYLRDESWIGADGERRLEQRIFDAVLARIARAERLVLVDMFLFNDWQGPEPERHRALADELAAALVARRRAEPGLVAVLVSDPINTVYGGLRSARLAALEAAGVDVVLTDLARLQDSNPLWSGLWRAFLRPFGNDADGGWLPNPLGPGRVTLRSYFALANFKANHRKLLVADDGADGLVALVGSANPHDGSSAHRNSALAFAGAAAADLLDAERALLALVGARETLARVDRAREALARARATAVTMTARDAASGGAEAALDPPTRSVQVLGESAIERALLATLAGAGAGSRVDLSMFYLADRDVVAALVAAARRGARVRALLDVNRDAFGREKDGVPNRPVAAELVRAGVAVRWCATRGEQCHAKELFVADEGDATLLLGSANFTRRNLDDYNLETDVLVRLPPDDPLARAVGEDFVRRWDNLDGRTYSTDYETHADESPWLKWRYRLMEASGLSTF